MQDNFSEKNRKISVANTIPTMHLTTTVIIWRKLLFKIHLGENQCEYEWQAT